MNTKTTTTLTRFRWAASDRYSLLKNYARQNRRNATLAESVLWEHLRNRELGFDFRRQHIISDFIADFVCLDRMLVVEVDGAYHSEAERKEEDNIRTERLNDLGFRVIRFTNEEVLNEITQVLEKIRTALRE